MSKKIINKNFQFCEGFKLLFKEVFNIELKDEENLTLEDLKKKYPIKDIIFKRKDFDFEFKCSSKLFKIIDWELINDDSIRLLYNSQFRVSFVKINKEGNRISPSIFYWYTNDYLILNKDNLKEEIQIISNICRNK